MDADRVRGHSCGSKEEPQFVPVSRAAHAASVVPSPRRPTRRLSVAVGLLSLLLVLFSLVPPAVAEVDAVSTYSLSARCAASMRTGATTAAALKRTVASGTRVVASGAVIGAAWHTKCGGTTTSGRAWYRITSIGGKSVKSLYGVSYLYAASGLFKVVTVSTPSYSVCSGTALRTSPSLSGTVKARLAAGTRVVSNGTRSGGAWSISCPSTATGTAWYRIISVNGKSVQSLYGVSYLWASKGLFAATMPAPDPTPSDPPSAPTASPSSTSAPTAPPTASPSAPPTLPPSPTPSPTPAMTPLPMFVPYPQQPVACLPPPSPTPTPVPLPTPVPPPTPTLNPSASPTPTPVPTPTPAPTPTPSWSCVTGVDVSNWQGTVDWSQVAAAGYKFAFLKATEGGWYIDPTYAANRAGANAYGIVIGAYDFAQPTTMPGQAQAEADFFVGIAMPQLGDLMPVLDLETTNGLSPANLQSWVTQWLYEVYARTGRRAAIYTSPSFWANAMGGSTWFAQNGFPLWLAHWTAATSPTVPALNWSGYSWSFWQWTSSGTVPGISGRVDLDRFQYADLTPYRVP